MSRKRLTDWLAYLAVRVVVAVIQALRIETCHAIARLLAVLFSDVVKLRARVVDENLSAVFPGLSAAQRCGLSRGMWEHLFLMVCEIAHAPRKIHRTNWRRYVQIDQKREIVRLLLAPRPTVLVSGHFGNFEIGGYITGLLGFPTFTVARPLDNPYLDRYVNRFRAANGQYMLPKQGSATQIDRVLASGGSLSLLGDQHAGPNGCWVDFLGRPASCHKAIALFSLTSNAPLLVGYARRGDRPMLFEFGLVGVADPRSLDRDLVGVKPLTQWYNQMLERVILSAPQQYWWVHRRWKDVPPRRRARRKRAAA